MLVDYGWVRVLGCGYDRLPDVVTQADAEAGVLTVGYDVMGGQFVWLQVRARREADRALLRAR